MTLRLGFAYNRRAPSPKAPADDDEFLEWEDDATIDGVTEALGRLGTVIRLEANADFPEKLRAARPDLVFNIAEGRHGPNREAHVPSICEFYEIPITGSDPLTLALSLDKRRTKEVLRANGVATPPSYVQGDALALSVRDGVRLPAIVKPLYEGSSKGIPGSAVCHSWSAVDERVAEIVRRYRQPALVEQFLPHREFSCAVLGNGEGARVLPIIELVLDRLPAGAAPIYGYEAKWKWDTHDAPLDLLDCPAAVEPPLAEQLARATRDAFLALGCRDWARVDLRLDEDDVVHVLEINPIPGIHPDPRHHSLFTRAARVAGLEYPEMIGAVVEHARARYGMSA